MSSAGHRRVVISAGVPAIPPNPAFRLGWATVTIVAVAYHLYTVSQWSWFQDDLMFMAYTTQQDTGEFIFQPNANHLTPGILALFWLVSALDPMNYAWAVLSISALAGLVVVVWGLFLRELFGERLHLVAGLVLLSVVPGLQMDSLFWNRGLATYSTLVAMGLCLWFLARLHVRGPSRRDQIGLALSYVGGLFMWEKCLVVSIPLLFLCLLLGPSDVRAAITNCVRKLWAVALLTAAYIPLFLYLTRNATEVRASDPLPRTVGTFLGFFGHGTVDVALPWMVGGPFSLPDSVGGHFDPTSVLALPLFAATTLLVIIGVRYRRRGYLAMAMVVTHALFAWGLVFFSNRYDFVGDLAVRAPRYSADLVPVMVLAALFMVTRTVLDDDVPVRPGADPRAVEWVRRGTVGYLALVCVVATIATGRVWDHLEPGSPKPYFDNILSESVALGAADVYDTRVPNDYVNPVLLDPGSRISAVVSTLETDLRFNQPTTNYLVVDDQGHFREAVVTGGQTNAAPPDPDCGFQVRPGQATEVPLNGELFPLEWVVDVTYFTGSAAEILVRTPDEEIALDVAANQAGGVGKLQFVVNGGLSGLTFEGVTGESAVCVTAVRVGLVEPTDQAPAQLG